jgi:branched-chain amino acid transport system substrate-binding protein
MKTKGIFFSVFLAMVFMISHSALAEVGVAEDSILFGHFAPMSGPGAYLGKMSVGLTQAWMKHVNDQGGIHGRKLSLVIEDNKYDPNLTKTAFFKLMDKNIFGLINVYGSSPCVAIMDDVQKAQIPVIPTYASTHLMFLPMKRYWFWLAGCGLESGVVVNDYIYGDLKLKDARVAICYQDDEWGKDGRLGTEIAAKKYGKKVVAAVSFKRGSKDLTSQVTTLMMSKATHVYFVGYAPDFAMLIKTAQNMNYRPQFIGDYVSVDARIADWGGPVTDGAWAIGVTGLPQEKGAGIDWAKEISAKYMPAPFDKIFIPLQLIIFAGSKVAQTALESCGRDLTREKFVDALGETGGLEMGGLVGKIGYSKTSRKGISQYRVYKFDYGQKKFTTLSDWRYPSIKAEETR